MCVHAALSSSRISGCQFRSCQAYGYGGGLYLKNFEGSGTNCFGEESGEWKDACVFDCIFSSCNPFYECYTTNENEQRVCYGYNNANEQKWTYDETSKKDWLKRGILNRFVAASGGGEEELCGLDESSACRTIGVAVHQSRTQTRLIVIPMEGNHQSEETTIEIKSIKVSVIGAGKEKSSIGTGTLSSTSITLFSVSTGHLGLLHMKVDCNSSANPSSPSVVVVSDGSGSLSLEDVVITASENGEYVISTSVFVVPLSQLSMVGVEIKDMNISEPLFSEPEHSSEESVLSNVTIQNVKLKIGDGAVVAKNVKSEETFVVSNITIENCECEEGNGGGICVCLTGDGDIVVNGTSVIEGCKAGSDGGNGGRGGGMMIVMENEGCGLTIGQDVEFSKVKENDASFGKDVFVDCGSGVFLELKVNINSFSFFDTSSIPSDVLRLSGSENGDESEVIPLFIYLCSMGTKVIVDGSGGNGMDHDHCGFEGFGCLTVDYCANSRLSESSNEMEVISSSSIAKEITGPSFDASISGRIVSLEEGERILVSVSDGESAT
ncbi:uncharacterized protein MONOS_13677 [Monocercomonoides exilis]|uniref:uncharacterized protein n=1 Tax=Monocercomonoides exilis TaxID=2049356 RepID=UPI0035599B61|nr:hypothetical protein MONOS_13677 [Monocercomonoides exilis]|eukprot:MONOS_13677.1-p1 / transcript=MONOS_13677.1 / gene=MONOS_13677 / organism=Monocercomonoides_exilis_PA203 / gene_product=unspecified product / transcript_product=unspecified product / location=Mono_scaffold00862:19438-21348(-) / protein_length=550 / sequence_SO=supercontig / SO=protein_coding / is_pseudo=false